MPHVLIVGSLHHDLMIEADHLPRRDETAVGARWYPKFGGKGGNQAVAVARAGVAARMFGAVGRDSFGAFLTAGLDVAGVDRQFVREIPDAGSGMSVAIMDATGDYAAAIVSGANLRLDADALTDDALWQDVTVLVLQNEVPETINTAAAAQARARGVTVVLNAAPARPLPPALCCHVDVLIVNAVEAEMMGTGAVVDLPSALAAAHHLATGFASVIVTAGAHGLAAWTPGEGGVTVPATPVTVLTTHGAGDSFTGTLAAAMARAIPLTQACKVASKAAADHVAGTGPDQTLFRKQ